MSDENEHKVVVWFGVACNLVKRLPQLRGSGLRTGERIHMRIGARGCEDSVQFFGLRRETLLVVRFATQPGHDDIVCGGGSAQGERAEHRQQECAVHSTPHLRRSSHSVAGRPRRSANTMGISQSSLVVRTEMPASE